MNPTTRDLLDELRATRPEYVPCPNPDCEDGEVWFNPSWNQDPQCEDSGPCPTCHGKGEVRA